MDIVEILGWAVFFYLMWQLVSAWVAMQQIKHAVHDAIDAAVAHEEALKKVTVVRLESVEQGSYLVVLMFDKTTNKFLGQANTEAEAKQTLQTRYPNQRFVIVDANDVVKATIQPT